MGYKINKEYFRTREEAVAHQKRVTGPDSGYSETYGMGVRPVRLIDQKTGDSYDGFVSEVEVYYG